MWRLGMLVLLRVTLTIAVLLTAYYLVPTIGESRDSDVPWLILSLAIFGVVVGIQLPAIMKSKYPNVRAIEALAVTVPLFLLIFARVYLSNSLANPDTFTVPLDHNSALYFTQHKVSEQPSFWRRILLRAEKKPIAEEPRLRDALFRWPRIWWRRKARTRQL